MPHHWVPMFCLEKESEENWGRNLAAAHDSWWSSLAKNMGTADLAPLMQLMGQLKQPWN